MNVEIVDRPDDQTVVCKVSWSDPETKQMLMVHVTMSATSADVPFPVTSGKYRYNERIPVTDHVRRSAILEAQKIASMFATLPIFETTNAPRP